MNKNVNITLIFSSLIHNKLKLFEISSPKGVKSALKKRQSGVLTDDLRAAISAIAN